MTSHGCGHCGATFDDRADLREHTTNCDVVACLVCGTEFDTRREKWGHDCPKAEPVQDPEGQFRAERRRREQQRKDDRRVAEDRRVGR